MPKGTFSDILSCLTADNNEVRRFPEDYWRIWTIPETDLLSYLATSSADRNAGHGTGLHTGCSES